MEWWNLVILCAIATLVETIHYYGKKTHMAIKQSTVCDGCGIAIRHSVGRMQIHIDGVPTRLGRGTNPEHVSITAAKNYTAFTKDVCGRECFLKVAAEILYDAAKEIPE